MPNLSTQPGQPDNSALQQERYSAGMNYLSGMYGAQPAPQPVGMTAPQPAPQPDDQKRVAMIDILGSLGTAIQTGTDPSMAFDAAAGAISSLTGAPMQQLQSYKQGFVSDPGGTLSRLQEQVGAAQPQPAAMQTQPQPAPQSAPPQDLVLVETKKEKAAAAAAPLDLPTAQARYDAAATFRAPMAELGGDDGYFSQAYRLIDKMPSNPLAARASIFAGVGPTAQLMAALGPITANMTLRALKAMDDAGVSLNPLTEGDRIVVTNTMGMLDAGVVPPAELKRNLQKVERIYDKYMAPLNTELSAAAENVRKLGGTAEGAPPTAAGGMTSVGANGEGYDAIPPGGQYRTSDGQIWIKGN